MPSQGGNLANLPRPAPLPPLPVANLTTGNNPRGVAIIQPSAPRPQVGGQDVLSSGSGYGSARANAYKQTPAYKNAVVSVFKAQKPAQQGAILQGALRSGAPEGKMVLDYLRSQGVSFGSHGLGISMPSAVPSILGGAGKAAENLYGLVSPGRLGPTGSLSMSPFGSTQAGQSAALKGIGTAANLANTGGHPLGQLSMGSFGATQAGHNALGAGLKGVTSGLNAIQDKSIGPAGQLSNMGVGAGPLGRVVTHAPIDVARALIEKPSAIPQTVTGLGTTALAAGAGLFQLPIRAVQQGPGPALSQLVHGMAKDYSNRYGPVAAGNDQVFIDRIKQQGAGPELLDALGLIGGGDATLGRGFTTLGKTREALGGSANFLTRARPALRISGNETRVQALGKGAGKITAQRFEDKLRGLRAIAPGQKAGEVSPAFNDRAQRVLVSGIQADHRRNMQGMLNTEVRGGTEKGLRALSPAELKAAPIVAEGFIPLRSGEKAAFQAIEARKQGIIKERATNPQSMGNRIAPQHAAQVDELRQLTDLQQNIPKWLTPKLADFQAAEAARAQRILKIDLRGDTASADARLLRAQGEMMGHPHPDEVAARMQGAAEVAGRGTPKSMLPLGAELNRARKVDQAGQNAARYANYAEARPGLLRDYSARIRAERPANWPEPSYYTHMPHPKENFSAYTQQGHRAMPGYKQSKFDLWRGGAVYRHPQVLVDSVAQGVKGAHQYKLVDELWRRNALPAPTAQAIRAALGHNKAPSLLTGFEHAQALAHMGVDLRSVKFGNPGRLSERTSQDLGYLTGKTHASRSGGPELTTDAAIHDALNQADVTMDGKAVHGALQHGTAPANEAFLKTTGWKAVPNAAYDEIHNGLNPSGAAGRLVGKVQGATAGAILSGSPSFVVMNTLAHALLATFGTKGRILTDMIKTPLWYHGLSDAEKAIVDANSRGRGKFGLEKLGSTAPGTLRAGWQAVQRSGVGRLIGAVNPVHVLWRAEDLQSNFFRRTVYYSKTKQMAFENMAHEMKYAAAAMQRVQHAFTLGPKQQMAGILHNQAFAEEAGRHVVNVMGDYARYTSRERRWLNNRSVLFYSFLRHSARTLLYVMPLHHPVVTALVGELGKLHKDEVQKILGPGPPPWAYGRVFFDKNGKLTAIDFTRASPVGNAVTDVPAQGLAGLGGLIAPEASPLLNMIYGQQIGGQKVPRNAFTLLNGLLSLSYPYRAASELHFGGKLQQPDSMPFIHERPQTRKSAGGQAYLAAKQAALEPMWQRLLGGFTGVYPQPSNLRVVTQHANQLAASKANSAAKKGALGAPVIPGSGNLNGAVIPGSGGDLSGAVIP
jgi:hypothetical protein